MRESVWKWAALTAAAVLPSPAVASPGYDALSAARDTAYWAGVSACAAWLAIFVSSAGVLLLAWQLRQNRVALEAASASAKAAADAAMMAGYDVRPWIAIEALEDAQVRRDAKERRLVVEVTTKNVGRTPATGLWMIVRQASETAPEALQRIVEEEFAATLHIGHALFPQETAGGEHTLILGEPDAEGRWYVFAAAAYYIPGDDQRRRTITLWQVRPGRGATLADRMYPAEADAWQVTMHPVPLRLDLT